MVEQEVSQIDLYLLINKVDQKLLIHIYIIRRTCWFPVVEAPQNNLSPYSAMILQIFNLAAGHPKSENPVSYHTYISISCSLCPDRKSVV